MIFVCSSEMMVPHQSHSIQTNSQKAKQPVRHPIHPYSSSIISHIWRIFIINMYVHICVSSQQNLHTRICTYTHSHHSNQHQHQHDAYQKRKTAYLCIALVHVSFRNNFGSTNIFHFS